MAIRSKKEALQDALADPFDPRPPSEKAKELGVADRTFRQWAGERKWWDEIYAKLQLRLEASLPRVVGALINKAVDKGDVPAAKLLLQIAGKR